MNCTERIDNDTITVFVSGEIDGTNVTDFEQALSEAIPKATQMVVDLKDLEYVSSAGLRVFLMMQKQTAARGHGMVIKNVTDDVMDIFSITGFVKLLQIEV